MKKVIMSLSLNRSARLKPFPERLVGFDTKVEGRFKFFILPDFADVIDAYLRINDKDKDGKPIPYTVGLSVTTDSFSNFMEEKRPRSYWKLWIPDTGSKSFLLAFAILADRFDLPASEMFWDTRSGARWFESHRIPLFRRRP